MLNEMWRKLCALKNNAAFSILLSGSTFIQAVAPQSAITFSLAE